MSLQYINIFSHAVVLFVWLETERGEQRWDENLGGEGQRDGWEDVCSEGRSAERRVAWL